MSKRTDTCIKKKCPFWHRYEEACPNFVEGVWESKEGDRYTTADCAPKRCMILQQQIYDFLLGARKDYNNMRNAATEVLKLASRSNGIDFIIDGEVIDETKQIEE